MRTSRLDQASKLSETRMETLEIHAEKLLAGNIVRPDKLLNDRSAPAQCRVENRQSVRAEDDDDPAVVFPEFVDVLDQCIDPDLVFMMGMILCAACPQRISLINDQDG